MSNIAFQIGDVVMLKSGGPDMTVESLGTNSNNGTPFVFCKWFDKDQKVMSTSFPPATLQKNDD
ncbi:MAG: DUF2158 domain-containing protein [Verrucomicrobiota bacterium]